MSRCQIIRLVPVRRAAPDPLQTFITTPADGRVGCEADIRAGLIHVGANRSLEQSRMPAEPLTCNYLTPLRQSPARSFVEQRLDFF
jgi:hypothetical protein